MTQRIAPNNQLPEQVEIERRRQMFHWFIDGLGLHGISWGMYDYLTPDFVTKYYNVNL